jgi:F-type H+-transporting ATPase subunit a
LSIAISLSALIFAAKFGEDMVPGSFKSLLVAGFSVFALLFSMSVRAQEKGPEKTGGKKGVFDANEVIFAHVLDAHQFHFLSYKKADGTEQQVTIPLPVIVYSAGRGFSVFMSSRFHHGEADYDGYRLANDKIVAVNSGGAVDPSVKVYDFSLTRNVVQMLISLALLVFLMIRVAAKYKTGVGTSKAPSGFQNAIEPVITFVRDEVAKPNLGNRYEKYLPYLLTIFFFILINSLVGLVPGTANVTGNIAFTAVLGVISFIVISVSANKQYWGHIFNPPVPAGINIIMIFVEILSIFTKPFALIIRLFANMVAGHIIIICLVSLIFIFGSLNRAIGWGFSPVSIAFAVFINLIEILVVFIQAFIFTNLTAVFIGQAIEDHHAREGSGHEDPVII